MQVSSRVYQGSIRGRTCSSCGKSNRRTAIYCIHCDQPFPWQGVHIIARSVSGFSVWLLIALLGLIIASSFQ